MSPIKRQPYLGMDRGYSQAAEARFELSGNRTTIEALCDRPATKPLICVIEDEPDQIDILRTVFEREGYEFVSARDGEEAIWVLRRVSGSGKPVLVILDLVLPVRSGLEICRFIRSNAALSDIPILVVSAKSGADIRVNILDDGADDFMAKPFSNRELLARVGALIRRCMKEEKRTLSPVRFSFGPLSVNTEKLEVLLNGHEIFLTRLEFSILHYLILQQGKIVEKDELIDFLWDGKEPVGDDNLKTHIYALRKKLKDHPERPLFIETMRGFGYRFKALWEL